MNEISVLERQLQAENASKGPTLAPPPLPALPKASPQPQMAPVADPTLRDNLASLAGDLGDVAGNTLGMLPLGAHPVGAAVVGGTLLGGLATAGMHFAEREKNRRQGTPSQKADRDYGAGIEARIKRNAGKARRFK